MDFKTAKCPARNGDLQVPADKDIVKCTYCGVVVVVRQVIQLAAGGNVQIGLPWPKPQLQNDITEFKENAQPLPGSRAIFV